MPATDKVSCFINNKQREMIMAEVERNGTRAIDTGKFTLPRNVEVTKGDTITYLQDPTNIKYLVGIWNFSDTTRDESGYDNDGLEDADETTATYSDGCDGRVISFANADANKVKITNDANHMKFDGQFDIIIWFASQQTSSPEGGLFSKGDSNNKIQIETTARSGGGNNEQYIKATIIKGGSTTVITGTNVNVYGSGTKDSSGYFFVRLKRDENDLVTLSVNQTSEGTATIRGDIATGSTFLYIGADASGTNVPRAKIAQVRFYSGGYVSDDGYDTLRKTRRQPNTMKFGGKVWKIDEKPTHKVAHCKGLAAILHNIDVNSDQNKANNMNVTWTTGDANIYKNNYKEKDGVEIITDLCKVYDTGIKVVDIDGNFDGSNQEYDEYRAVGTIYQNLVILSLNGSSDSSFSIDARKVLRLEDNDIDYYTGSALGLQQTENNHSSFSKIIFKQGRDKIISLGYDDSSTTTYITGVTNILTKENISTGTHSGNTPNFTDSYTTCVIGTTRRPIQPNLVKVTHSAGTTLTNVTYSGSEPSDNTEFKVGFDSNGKSVIILGGTAISTGTYTFTFNYEDLGNSYYYSSSSNESLGFFGKKLYLPQFIQVSGNVSLTNFTTRFLARFATINRRFTVRVPTLVNHVRENYKVKLIDSDHGQTTELTIPIKSVKFYYPEGYSIIDLGDHHLDSYDLDAAFGSALHELRSVITTTQPL